MVPPVVNNQKVLMVSNLTHRYRYRFVAFAERIFSRFHPLLVFLGQKIS